MNMREAFEDHCGEIWLKHMQPEIVDEAWNDWQAAWQASRAALEEAAPEWTRISDELPTGPDMYLVRYTGDGGYDLMMLDAVIENQHDLLEWMLVPHNKAKDGSSEGEQE